MSRRSDVSHVVILHPRSTRAGVRLALGEFPLWPWYRAASTSTSGKFDLGCPQQRVDGAPRPGRLGCAEPSRVQWRAARCHPAMPSITSSLVVGNHVRPGANAFGTRGDCRGAIRRGARASTHLARWIAAARTAGQNRPALGPEPGPPRARKTCLSPLKRQRRGRTPDRWVTNRLRSS